MTCISLLFISMELSNHTKLAIFSILLYTILVYFNYTSLTLLLFHRWKEGGGMGGGDMCSRLIKVGKGENE